LGPEDPRAAVGDLGLSGWGNRKVAGEGLHRRRLEAEQPPTADTLPTRSPQFPTRHDPPFGPQLRVKLPTSSVRSEGVDPSPPNTSQPQMTGMTRGSDLAGKLRAQPSGSFSARVLSKGVGTTVVSISSGSRPKTMISLDIAMKKPVASANPTTSPSLNCDIT
jgi:hypothetical protein